MYAVQDGKEIVMRQSVRWLIVASMAVGGVGITATPAFAGDKDVSGNTSAGSTGANATVTAGGQFALPAGIAGKDLKEDKDIRKAFGDVVAASCKHNGFSDVVDCFVDQDRTRFNQYKEQSGDKLNDVVAKFRSEWKSKYGKDFDLTSDEKVKAFSGVAILTGEIQTPDQLAGAWPIKQPANLSVGTNGAKLEDKAQPAASKQEVEQAKGKYFGGDVNLDKGRDVAVAKLPSVLGLPEVHCSLIKEHTTGWRFDVPNDISGQGLHDSLVKHLTMVVDHKDQWPSNVDEAYGMVSHHVIEAIYGFETMSGQGGSK
jgi:hypothetical protein